MKVARRCRTSEVGQAILLGLVSAMASCTSHLPRRPSAISDEERAEARHWVHQAQLQQIMQALERQHLAVWPQEIQEHYAPRKSSESQQAFAQAAVTANALSGTARRIGETAATANLSEADRVAFLSQADTLRRQAIRLEIAARREEYVRMREALAAIESTCQTCHERFRDVSGPR